MTKGTRGVEVKQHRPHWGKQRLEDLRLATGHRMGLGRGLTQDEMAVFLGFVGDRRQRTTNYNHVENGRRWVTRARETLLELLEAGILPPGWQRVIVGMASVRRRLVPRSRRHLVQTDIPGEPESY